MSRSVLKNNPHVSEDRLVRLVQTMERAFPEAMVSGHETLIPAMTNDPKDRHVLAAAVRDRADVTLNVRDFPPLSCEPHDVNVQTPDEFLLYQLEMVGPDALLDVFRLWAASLKNPPLDLASLIERLERVAPRFAGSMREAAAGRRPGW